MESEYSSSFRDWDENNSYYEGEFQTIVALPEGYDVTLPSTGRAVVDEAVANIIPMDLTIHYPPRGQTKKAEEDADLIRRYLRGLWNHWRRKGSDIDTITDACKNLVMHGIAGVKITPDWTLWPVLPDVDKDALRKADPSGKKLKERVNKIKELRDRHTPLVIRSLPPQCMMMDATLGGRKTWQIERYEAAPADVRNLYAQFVPEWEEFWRATTPRPVHEIWTATRSNYKGEIEEGKHFIFIDRMQVYEGPNPYDDLPYVVKYSGFGRESYDGKPRYKAVGLYTPQVKSLLAAQARRFSQFDAMMSQTAFTLTILPQSVDIDAFDNTPGAINPVPDDVFMNSDKIFISPVIPDGKYLNSLGQLDAQIERGTTQAALRGAPVTGTDSAAQLDMTTGQAMKRIEAAQQAMEDLVAELFSKALFFIDKILQDKTSVFVAEKETNRYTVGPENIRGRYDVAVTFLPNEEQLKARKLSIASDAYVKGPFSRYDALVYASFDNASEIIARRDLDDLMQEPLVKRGLAKQMLRDWGVDADEVALEEQVEQGQLQKLLSDLMNQLQTGSMRGVGNPMTETGAEPSGGAPPVGGPPTRGQDPMAALAQQGLGAMPQPVGAQPQAAVLAPPGAPA